LKLKIEIVTPAPLGSLHGNRMTALRWQKILTLLNHQCTLAQEWTSKPCDVLVALHGLRSFESIQRFKHAHPTRPLVLIMTGTDIYRDLKNSEKVHRSMDLADAIVVLSGGRVVAPGAEAVSEWGDVNRFFGGIELFKADRAPLLIFTGGWSPLEPKARPEGEWMLEYARTLGVPTKNMLSTGPVFNTAEESQAVAALLSKSSAAGRKPHVLLVTSAFHVNRAQRLFERAGLRVSPFPVDFKVSAGGKRGFLDFLPSAGALELTNKAWHEMYGRLYYAIRAVVQ
jgi:uncharacterized SAM-binding protein YcdF (DUF218 family)